MNSEPSDRRCSVTRRKIRGIISGEYDEEEERERERETGLTESHARTVNLGITPSGSETLANRRGSRLDRATFPNNFPKRRIFKVGTPTKWRRVANRLIELALYAHYGEAKLRLSKWTPIDRRSTSDHVVATP